jgi:hypothetical protein
MPSQDQAPRGEVEDVAEGQEDVNPPLDRDEDDDDGQPPVVPEQGYGGGPSDVSLLHDYHKHMAILIWEARNSEAEVNIYLKFVNQYVPARTYRYSFLSS